MDDCKISRYAGFTVAEFIAVIVVLGILAAFALPRWPGYEPGLNGQAQALMGDIRYAQSLAMTQGTHYRVNLLSTTTYSITTAAGGAVLNPSTGSNVVTLNDSVVFGTFTGTLPNSLVAFDGKGAPFTDSTATTTALAVTATIPLTVGGATCNVQIAPETGKVSVSC